MGFSTSFTTLAADMLSQAADFVGDILPIIGVMAGIAIAGYALMQVRRFIG